MSRISVALLFASLAFNVYANNEYTVLDANQYHKTVSSARTKITKILDVLQANNNLDADSRIALITHQLADLPYLHNNGMGEGDWQPTSTEYRPGAQHINQNPVYRLDGLNCQTFVQVAMALLHANNLSQFDKNILKVSYGAAGNPTGQIVHYYNRNNFIDADFNPVNQRNGWLTDITSQGTLSSYTKKTHATITRQKWFLYQQKNLADNVQVLTDASGPAMVKRFKTLYSHLNFPHFDEQQIEVSYLPKEMLALLQPDGSYKPNDNLLNKISTPAIAEIVRDVGHWNNITGSELTISHLGILYRQKFNNGDLIYRKTTCTYDDDNKKVCYVTPIICKRKSCEELMFTHATNAYPMKYFWYQTANGNYTCSPHKPKQGIQYTSCNRVIALPFYDYLTEYQLGNRWNMALRSILGVHLEKLN